MPSCTRYSPSSFVGDTKTVRNGSMSSSTGGLDETMGQVSVKLSRTKTWAGTETAPTYGPGDVAHVDYERDLGDPGQYPFTRGAYPKMYRSRMWTLRNIV